MENTMTIKKIIAISLFLFCFQTGIQASAGEHHHDNFDSGSNSPFVKSDHFPRDYFLIPYNLPHYLGLILAHDGAQQCGLSREQLEAIKKIKMKTYPVVMQKAKDIKKMEVQLARSVVEMEGGVESRFPLVEIIAKAKTELTKIHLRCLDQVRQKLTKEQYAKLIQLAQHEDE